MKPTKDLLKLDTTNLKNFLENLENTTNLINAELYSQKMKQQKIEDLSQNLDTAMIKIKLIENSFGDNIDNNRQIKEMCYKNDSSIKLILNLLDEFDQRINNQDKVYKEMAITLEERFLKMNIILEDNIKKVNYLTNLNIEDRLTTLDNLKEEQSNNVVNNSTNVKSKKETANLQHKKTEKVIEKVEEKINIKSNSQAKNKNKSSLEDNKIIPSHHYNHYELDENIISNINKDKKIVEEEINQQYEVNNNSNISKSSKNENNEKILDGNYVNDAKDRLDNIENKLFLLDQKLCQKINDMVVEINNLNKYSDESHKILGAVRPSISINNNNLQSNNYIKELKQEEENKSEASINQQIEKINMNIILNSLETDENQSKFNKEINIQNDEIEDKLLTERVKQKEKDEKINTFSINSNSIIQQQKQINFNNNINKEIQQLTNTQENLQQSVLELKNQFNELNKFTKGQKHQFKIFLEEQSKHNYQNDKFEKETKLNISKLEKFINEIKGDNLNQRSKLKVKDIKDNLLSPNKINFRAESNIPSTNSILQINSNVSQDVIQVIDVAIKKHINNLESNMNDKNNILELKISKVKERIVSEIEINNMISNKVQLQLDLFNKIEIRKIYESIADIRNELIIQNGEKEYSNIDKKKQDDTSNLVVRLNSKVQYFDKLINDMKNNILIIQQLLDNASIDYECQIIPYITDKIPSEKGKISSKNIFRLNRILFKYLIEKLNLIDPKIELVSSDLNDKLKLELSFEIRKIQNDIQVLIKNSILPIKEMLNNKADIEKFEKYEQSILTKITSEFNKKIDKVDLTKSNLSLMKKIDFIENKLTKTFVDSIIEIQANDKPLLFKNSNSINNKCISCDRPLHDSNMCNYHTHENSLHSHYKKNGISSIAHQAKKLNIGSYSKFLEFSDPKSIKNEINESQNGLYYTNTNELPSILLNKKEKNTLNFSQISSNPLGESIVSIKKKIKPTLSSVYHSKNASMGNLQMHTMNNL